MVVAVVMVVMVVMVVVAMAEFQGLGLDSIVLRSAGWSEVECILRF